MTKSLDLDAVYVDFSDTEKPLVKSIILDEQGNATMHPLSASALSITEEQLLGCMDLEEKHLNDYMELQKKIYLKEHWN